MAATCCLESWFHVAAQGDGSAKTEPTQFLPDRLLTKIHFSDAVN